MSSKQLQSILNKVPFATAVEELSTTTYQHNNAIKRNVRIETTERLVARVPRSLKEELRCYTREHKGETETTIIMKALKLMGFNVDSELLVDKRTLR